MSTTELNLSLTADYAQSWTSREGIREFNWYDGMREPLTLRELKKFSVDRRRVEEKYIGTVGYQELGVLLYNKKTKLLSLSNTKVVLSRKILLLGYSSKKGKQHLVGQFGEGMKLGILACLRENKTVTIFTGNEIWSFSIKYDKNFEFNTLSVKIDEVKARKGEDKNEGTRFEISDVQNWDKLCNDYLFLRPPKDFFRASIGTLMFDSRLEHKLFVKGFWIADMPEEGGLTHGVDFEELRIDRDRRAVVKQNEINKKLVQIWSEALMKKPELVPHYYEMLKDETASADVRTAYRHLNDLAVDLLATQFLSTEGADAFPIWVDSDTAKKDFQQLRDIGKEPVYVSRTLHRVLERSMKVGTLEQLLNNYTGEYGNQSWHSLTASQLQVLHRVAKLMKKIDREFDVSDIEVSTFEDAQASTSYYQVRASKIILSTMLLDLEHIHANYWYDKWCCRVLHKCTSDKEAEEKSRGENKQQQQQQHEQQERCYCREARVIECLIKGRATVSENAPLDAELQLRFGVFAKLLGEYYIAEANTSSAAAHNSANANRTTLYEPSVTRSSYGVTSTSSSSNSSAFEVDVLKDQLSKMRMEMRDKDAYAKEVEDSLRAKVHDQNTQRRQAEDKWKSAENRACNAEEALLVRALEVEQLKEAAMASNGKVLEAQKKALTMQQQCQSLLVQVDQVRGDLFMKEERLREAESKAKKEISRLQEEFEALEEKYKAASRSLMKVSGEIKSSSSSSGSSGSSGKENDEVVRLRLENEHLKGMCLDVLTREELLELEMQCRTTLKNIDSARQQAIEMELIALKKQNERLQEEKLCAICVESEIAVVFLPCRHRCVCHQCSTTVRECPLCRKYIDQKIELFS